MKARRVRRTKNILIFGQPPEMDDAMTGPEPLQLLLAEDDVQLHG